MRRGAGGVYGLWGPLWGQRSPLSAPEGNPQSPSPSLHLTLRTRFSIPGLPSESSMPTAGEEVLVGTSEHGGCPARWPCMLVGRGVVPSGSEYTDTQSVTRCCGWGSLWGQDCSVFALWWLWELTRVMKLCRTTHTHRPRQALTARYPAHMHTDMHTCTSIHMHAQTSAHLPVECRVFISCLVFSTLIV